MVELEGMQGVVYALPKDIISRFFNSKKNVFIKYLAHKHSKKSKNRLAKGMKLFFYQSQSNKSIVGEAHIKAIHFLNYTEIIKLFSTKLMLSKKEFDNYSEGRKDKTALVLELSNIKKYSNSKKTKKPVTMGGIYVTNFNKKDIFVGV